MCHGFGVWEVEATDQFGAWWSTLTDGQRTALIDRVDRLIEDGPDLGRRSSIGFIRHAITE